jgi:hypothetical protein
VTKAAGVLEHCGEGETNCRLSVFHGVYIWPRPKGDDGYQCTFLLPVAVPVHYTCEQQELVAATMYDARY